MTTIMRYFVTPLVVMVYSVPKRKIRAENRAKTQKIVPKKINEQKALGHNATAGQNATHPMGHNATLPLLATHCEISTYDCGAKRPKRPVAKRHG